MLAWEKTVSPKYLQAYMYNGHLYKCGQIFGTRREQMGIIAEHPYKLVGIQNQKIETMKKLLFSAIAVIGVVGTSMALTKTVGFVAYCSTNPAEPGACDFNNPLVGIRAITYVPNTLPQYCTSTPSPAGDCNDFKTLIEQP